MKKSSFILVLFFILLFAACSKNDSSTNPNNTTSGKSMSANITGFKTMSFTADNVVYLNQSISGMSQTAITGVQGNTTGNATEIVLQLINLNLGPSTLTLGDQFNGSVMLVIVTNGNATQIVCTTGTINITENSSTKISGTFDITGGDVNQGNNIHVTNGVFSIVK